MNSRYFSYLYLCNTLLYGYQLIAFRFLALNTLCVNTSS